MALTLEEQRKQTRSGKGSKEVILAKMVDAAQKLKLDKENRDTFCWTCHYEDPELGCQNCERSYCKNVCYKMLENYPPPIIETSSSSASPLEDIVKLIECQECAVLKQTQFGRIDGLHPEQRKQLFLAHIQCWVDWFKEKQIICDMKTYGDELVDFVEMTAKGVDLATVNKLIIDGKVPTLEAFVGCIKWIKHNSIFFNGRMDTETILCEKFERMVFKQANRLAASCMQCEIWLATPEKDKPKDWFSRLCDTPHVVGWAKIKGYPHWPAKIISATSLKVDVIFFRDHKRSEVRLEDVILSASKPPEKKQKGKANKKPASLSLSIQEAEVYVAAMEMKFGNMNKPPDPETIQPFTEEYLRRIFPGLPEILLEKMVTPSTLFFKPNPFAIHLDEEEI